MKQNLILAHGQAFAALRKCMILFTMLLTVGLSARAQVFEVGDLRYEVTSEADRTVSVCVFKGEPIDVVIPEIVENGGVKYAVTSIQQSAFWNCTSLASVTIPNSVTSIGDLAFSGCTSLVSVSIPNSVTSIGNEAFAWCEALTSVTIPNSVTSIEESAFSICRSLASVTIPNSVTSIGNGAFSGCTSLSSVSIPNSVTSIEYGTFNRCTSLTSVTIPNSVTSIGQIAFSDCTSLTSVTIPSSVTSIGGWAFYGCTSLTSVTIPSSVTSIEYDTFNGCTSLTSVTIPNSVKNLGGKVFEGCTSLKTIYSLPTTPPEVGEYGFEEVPKDAVVYVPEGTVAAYSAAKEWRRFFDFREMSSGVSELPAGCEARPADVYNMQGMLVKARASQADIDALAPGLYIIAGHKVLVK